MAYYKKNPNMTFQGECKIPLNCDKLEDFVARSRFTGDWFDPKKRKRILGKKRWYRVCLYLVDVEGVKFHSSNHPDLRLDSDDLIAVLQTLVRDVMLEYPENQLDKNRSDATISVPKPSSQVRKKR